ncbi:ABC transporter ATP-binding protein [Synechocystis sp. PCC 7509]|uniref:ABC transporter ATP-binding protein n=1 Tax=Synechocystis sp. PCC 7509 TaxID=927677 RepID=UPI0002AC6194|nr:ABC transporter ATP-binding protein [Synechocystis sp. PCC 7509]
MAKVIDNSTTMLRLNNLIPPELAVVNMTKKFGTMTALDNVSMTLKPGSFHALLGENGAGKSTLVKCLMGFYTPTSGKVLIDNQLRQIDSPRDAHKYSVGMVYQHFTSVPAMTVAENLVLSKFDSPNLINWKAEKRELNAFMQTAPFQIPLNIPITQLAAGQKQKLEILKQLYLKNRILILDEPTSVLTPAEADEVLGLLRQQVSLGQLSVLMISHKFREVTAFVDEITVLRKGKFAGSGLVKDLTVADMAHMMMGEKRSPTPVSKVAITEVKPVLEIKNLHANKDNGTEAVAGVNLNVHNGEIVGIAGISGNGQRELVEVLAGQRLATSGEVLVNKEPYTAKREQIYRHKVFTLPEEPLRNACVASMSVAENLAFRTFDKSPQSVGGALLVMSAIRNAAKTLIQTFSIKTPSADTPVGNLSGGNVQRTVLARELAAEHINLLIAANPCFGLDFAAVDYIHSQIVAARNRGVAVMLVSEDLDELLKLSDRIVVISEGKFVYESEISQADFATIGRSMAGH